MLGSLFGSFTGALGKRFFLTAWLPSLLLAGAVLAELATAPGLSRTVDWVQSLPGLAGAAGVAAFLLAVTVAATLISVNVTSLLRFCEGYWGAGWLHRHVGCRRRAHYRDVVAKLSSTDLGYEQIYQRFPPPDLQDAAMPTRVGNILLGSEIYPYVRYGMDAGLVLAAAVPRCARQRARYCCRGTSTHGADAVAHGGRARLQWHRHRHRTGVAALVRRAAMFCRRRDDGSRILPGPGVGMRPLRRDGKGRL